MPIEELGVQKRCWRIPTKIFFPKSNAPEMGHFARCKKKFFRFSEFFLSILVLRHIDDFSKNFFFAQTHFPDVLEHSEHDARKKNFSTFENFSKYFFRRH